MGVYRSGTVEIVWEFIGLPQSRLYGSVWVWHSGDCMGCISLAQWRFYGGVSVWHSGDCWHKINVYTKLAISYVCLRLSLRRLSSIATEFNLAVTKCHRIDCNYRTVGPLMHAELV